MNIQQMMKQAQQMQERMQKQMAELGVEASSGGGMVHGVRGMLAGDLVRLRLGRLTDHVFVAEVRGVSLLGIASAGTARSIRESVWQHLASDWKPAHLDAIGNREVTLAMLPEVFPGMLAGNSFGRTIVKL